MLGGNPGLRAESADTYSLGLTVQPEFLEDFTASIDYYRIEMEDLVGALPATLILSECLESGDPTFCSQLVRNPVSGTLNGPSVAAGGYIVQTSVNVGAGILSGVDLQSTYRYDIGSLGELRFTLNAAYLLKNETTPIPNGGSYDCAGLFGPTCQTVNPEWQHSLRTGWNLPNGMNLALTWRYYAGVDLDNNDSNPLLSGVTLGDKAIFRATMPSVSYFDLSGSWDITEQLQVRGGINNLFDKDPPLAPTELVSGGAPNYYEFYDALGRQVFAAFTARF